ncbi:hypothetical protein B0T16DRAFT_454363 [Cercophora newfieldiana]|uniref:FAD/NAD(P)-binding domain-containing protein n=1 Tax=Cercophora newfieldiana TaxID=92897 RepID=A0AA40CUJ5_9PEZI|nr:hypothetical protein B0T16DRAFT_454363 [Cercophora newfieldiana]
MAKTVVILGAAYAGVPIAHYLVKYTALKVEGGLKVILVSPNSDLYWHNAAVRGILPGQIPDEKLFYPIAKSFSKYPTEHFESVLGKAQAVDPAKRSVLVRKNDGSEQTITYDELVIATGTSYKDGLPLKDGNSTEETKAALAEWRTRIDKAKSIVVAGGGESGVEIAAELGEEYASRRLKAVTLIVAGDLPLPPSAMTDVRETVKKELERLKVEVLNNSKVLGTKQEKGKTIIELSSGKTLEADLFIPVFGIVPNTSFLPREMLDDAGYVKQTTSMRVDGYENIYVVGDAGNLEVSRAVNADYQLQYLAKTLNAKLTGAPEPEQYKINPKVMFGISLGKSRGTGQMGTWKPWSLLIWWFKSRHLGVPMGQPFADGLRTATLDKW